MSKPDESVLSPEARSIVDAARLEEDPSGADVDRLRGRVFAHLGIGIGTAAAASLVAGTTAEAAVVTSASTSAAKAIVSTTTALGAGSGATAVSTGGATASVATTAGAGFLAKLGLIGSTATAAKLAIAVAVASAGTAGVVAVSGPTEAVAPAAPTAVVSPPSAIVARDDDASRADVKPAAGVPQQIAPSGAEEGDREVAPAAEKEPPPPEVARVAPRPPVGPSAVAPSPSAESDPLAEETALLARAQSALAAGRHDEALAALDQHQKRFPKGVLSQERNGARLLALCGSGRAAQARDAVKAFLDKQPTSPLAARLRSSCGI